MFDDDERFLMLLLRFAALLVFLLAFGKVTWSVAQVYGKMGLVERCLSSENCDVKALESVLGKE